jgi:ATP-binding cassette subfamily F protein 3
VKTQKVDVKKIKAEMIQNRSKELAPLRKRATALEERIHHNEEKMKEYQNKLIHLQGKEMGDAQKQLASVEKIVESDFEEFTQLQLRIEEITADYERKISELSSHS